MILSHAPSIHIQLKRIYNTIPYSCKILESKYNTDHHNNRDIPKDYKPEEQQIPGTSYSAVCESELEKNEMEWVTQTQWGNNKLSELEGKQLIERVFKLSNNLWTN